MALQHPEGLVVKAVAATLFLYKVNRVENCEAILRAKMQTTTPEKLKAFAERLSLWPQSALT